MGLVYVVADQQCVLVFASHRHSSYRFGFLRVGPRRPSPVVVYNTVRGTVERPRRRGPRGSDTARGSNAVWCRVRPTRGLDGVAPRPLGDTRPRRAPARRAGQPRIGCEKSGLPRVDSRAGTSGDVCETERRKAEPCGESTVLAPPGDGGTAAARARARLGR